MTLLNFVKAEFSNWGKYERIFFPFGIFLIISVSIYLHDSKIALVSAICGISYTILAGKGRISCYFFGMTGTLCYAYLAFKNALYGNCLLYLFYYFPSEIIGIFQWKKHLNKKSQEIVKTMLTTKERYAYFLIAAVLTALFSIVLKKVGDATPFIDAFTTIFSMLGMLLTIKRCIEQWPVWLAVNALSMVMWINAYIKGSNCFATILMWVVYLVLAVYFWHSWKKEINASKVLS